MPSFSKTVAVPVSYLDVFAIALAGFACACAQYAAALARKPSLSFWAGVLIAAIALCMVFGLYRLARIATLLARGHKSEHNNAAA